MRETQKWVKNIVGHNPIIRIIWRGIPTNAFAIVKLPWLIEITIIKEELV